MHQLRLLPVAALAAVAFALVGCGGSDKPYYIPVDHQIRPFAAPDEADETGEEDAELDEEDGGAETPGAASEAISPAPAEVEPVKVPAKPRKGGKSASSGQSGSGSP